MPRGVFDRLREYAETWSSKGVKAWADEWWEMPVRVGDVIAPLIGARKGEVSMQPNITTTEAVILSCFEPKGTRNKIVCEELNFPSVLYLYRNWARQHHCKLQLIKSVDGISIDLDRLLRAIDEKTLLVPISHVLFKSAFIQDARAIIKKAHKVGAKVVLDAYQSVGIIPVDVKRLDVDFLVGGVLKWLCGGPGGAFLYVRPDLARKIKPRLTGWFAHKRPFAFETGEIDYRDDAFRFLSGTPSIPALYAAETGPKIIQEVGVKRIREKSLQQTQLLIALADEAGFTVMSPRESQTRGGTVTLSVPHAYEVSCGLIERDILVDFRKGAGIRVAPHFYNTDDEIQFVMAQIKEILETQAFAGRKRRKSVVT
ncbi:MAG: aminotransferase class V-fold PLP-dependent enzyme [Ignavibacteriales bacterium]|nr:aminotransferase class V-fold PLP-dependent enzyme [Ignavibacteriales bacterium]